MPEVERAEGKRRALAEDDEGRLDKMQAACATLIECLGEDTSRQGLVKTPRRMAKALLSCTQGYGESLESIVNGAVFEENHHEMILVKDIDFHSLCEHHMVPFTGKVHIAYIPRSKVRSVLVHVCWTWVGGRGEEGGYVIVSMCLAITPSPCTAMQHMST